MHMRVKPTTLMAI